MDDAKAVAALTAVAQETRLNMVKLLVRAGQNGMSAGEVAKAVEAAPSRASFHLAALEKAGLVTSQKQAREVHYRADFKTLGALLQFMMEDCCAGNEEILSCCAPRGCC